MRLIRRKQLTQRHSFDPVIEAYMAYLAPAPSHMARHSSKLGLTAMTSLSLLVIELKHPQEVNVDGKKG